MILINCRFCICEFDYFLKFICNRKREAGERREEKTAAMTEEAVSQRRCFELDPEPPLFPAGQLGRQGEAQISMANKEITDFCDPRPFLG